MNWLRKKFRILVFKWRLRSLVRRLLRQGVPHPLVKNILLALGGEYPMDKIKEELASYFKEST